MRRHLKEVHVTGKSFKCDVANCNKTFTSRYRVHDHKKMVHWGNAIKQGDNMKHVLECNFCGVKKNNKTSMQDHILCAHMGIKYVCDICQKDFTSNKGLKRHKLIHSKPAESRRKEDPEVEDMTVDEYKELVKNKIKICPKCDKEFPTPRYMRRHLRDMHSAQKSHVCEECGNQYKTKSSLTEHRKYMHTEKARKKREEKFECAICGTLHATKYTLRDHINTHTGYKYECEICGHGYASRKHLTRHKLKHMKDAGQLSEDRIFKCDQCNREFLQNNHLKKHLEWVHGDKYHLCKVCGAKIKGDLRQHMITHTGEKKYCCHICGKKLRGKLSEHMLTHTGERPFPCQVCGSTFKDKWYLRIHMRKHSGERPYMCSECGSSFAARSAFTLHMKKHAGVSATSVCEFCREVFLTKELLKEHLKIHFV